jgi:DNA-binding transcriptional LysR family regulator
MELRHLRYFVAVAEELHFGRAAQRLGIAQPPLSQQIRRLEEELGITLLQRTKRRVELTEPGRIFLDGARQTLEQAAAAARMAQRAERGEIGRLAVGFVGPGNWLPLVLRPFRARHPGVELTLHQLGTARQVDALKAGRLDVGLLRPPLSGGQGLSLETVAREAIVAALPRGHRLGTRRRVLLKGLKDEPFVLFPRAEGPGFYDQIVALCHKAGFSPRVVQEAAEMRTILNLVAGAVGVSLVPKPSSDLRLAGAVYRPLQGPTSWTELALAWRDGDDRPALRAFLGVVRAIRPRRT